MPVWSKDPPIVTDRHGCGYGAKWKEKRKACELVPARRPHGQTGYGSLRMVREPLVELFPPKRDFDAPSFWIYIRLNRKPTHVIDTILDGARHDLDTPLGIDQESHDGRCIGIEFDIPPDFFTAPLRNPRPGRRVKVTIRSGDLASSTTPTRIRLALPQDGFGEGQSKWFRALGCRAD